MSNLVDLVICAASEAFKDDGEVLVTGIGVVPVGRIETGMLKIGAKVIAMPGRAGDGVKGEVKTIEMFRKHSS